MRKLCHKGYTNWGPTSRLALLPNDPDSRTHVQCAILELKVGPAQFPQPTDLRHAVLSAVAGRQAPAGWQAVEVRPLAATEDASVRRVHV